VDSFFISDAYFNSATPGGSHTTVSAAPSALLVRVP